MAKVFSKSGDPAGVSFQDRSGVYEFFLWLLDSEQPLKGGRPVDRVNDTEVVRLVFGATFEVGW